MDLILNNDDLTKMVVEKVKELGFTGKKISVEFTQRRGDRGLDARVKIKDIDDTSPDVDTEQEHAPEDDIESTEEDINKEPFE